MNEETLEPLDAYGTVCCFILWRWWRAVCTVIFATVYKRELMRDARLSAEQSVGRQRRRSIIILSL